MFYHDVLLILHLLGLAAGLGIGVANMLIARTAAASPPDQAGVLRALAPRLGQVATVGLGVLVVTGLLLLFQRGWSFLNFWFYLKLISVAGMVAISYLIYQAQAEIRRGNMAAAARMPIFGPAIGGLGVLTLIFSVFAFH